MLLWLEFVILTRIRDMQFLVSRPLAMCAISWTTLPFDRISHSLRVFSSCRKSKILFGGTGRREEVAALSTIPEGLPESSTLLLVMTPTSLAPVPDSVDGRGTDASIEAYRYSLRQFHHTLSSLLISNNTSISNRNVGCHGTGKALVLPVQCCNPPFCLNACPELTSCLYRL